jgi:hypothetical protein
MRRILIAAVIAAAATALATGIASGFADDSMPAHTMDGTVQPDHSAALTRDIALARVALAPYATDLAKAQQAGWSRQITPMMQDMGFHYMDPSVSDFQLTKPPILVYIHHGSTAQLVAAEWVFPTRPAKAPIPGARYGSFPAACHYADGTFVPQSDQNACAQTSHGAAFVFWHPKLVTLHLWLWYPNPAGLFHSTNPLVAPFNHER